MDAKRLAVPARVDSPAKPAEPAGIGRWLLRHQAAPVGPRGREIIRQHEPDPTQRPTIHVGG